MQTGLRMLGPLEACVDGSIVSLGGTRQRAVLAILLVNRGQEVPAEHLADAVWGDAVPRSATGTLQAYVSRLRKITAVLGGRIDTGSLGYVLRMPPQSVDLEVFDAGLDAGRRLAAAHRHAEAAHRLSAALQLWRTARVLDGLDQETWAAAPLALIKDRRVAAQDLLVESLLALSRPVDAILLLESMFAERPYDEQAAAQLMLALYRAGRTADSLSVYDRCRRSLAEDLGLEPSPALRRRQQAVLRQSPELEWTPLSPRSVTRLLPPRNPRFSGREEVIAELRPLLHAREIVTVHGLAGCGKSALALELAHRHDGVAVWINAQDGASALSAMVGLAEELGISTELDSAAMLGAIWRELKHLEGWLLVFDDASDPALVRELIPPDDHGSVLITSQDPAWGTLGVTRPLAPFTEDEAVEFTLTRSGRSDPDAARALSEVLGNLPLALEQACVYVERAGLTLPEYLALFERSSLRLLARGAPGDHVRDVATTWRLLFDDVRAASPLAGTVLEVSAFLSPDGVELGSLTRFFAAGRSELDVHDAIADLMRCSLIQRDRERVRVHQLVQLVVRSGLASATRAERAAQAVALLTSVLPTDPSGAMGWPQWSLVARHVTSLVRACPESPPPALTPLVLHCYRYLRAFGANKSAGRMLDALTTALLSDPHDRRAEIAQLKVERGDLLDAVGDLPAARAELREALTMISGLADSDPLTIARALVRLAHADNCADESTRALTGYQQAIALLADTSNETELVQALIGCGYTLWALHDFAQGQVQFEAAIECCHRAGLTAHPLLAEALSGLGMMLHDQGALPEARRAQERALDLLHQIHDDENHLAVAETRDKYGYVLGLLGEHEASLEQHLQSVAIMQSLFGDHDTRVATSLTNLGLAEARLGQLADARDHQRQAVEIFLAADGPDHRDTRRAQARLDELELSVARTVTDASSSKPVGGQAFSATS